MENTQGFHLSDRSVYAYLEENARLRGERVAYLSEDERYTWREAFCIYRHILRTLRGNGVGAGKRIAVGAGRNLDTPLFLFAALGTGALVMTFDPAGESGPVSDFILKRRGDGLWELSGEACCTIDKRAGLSCDCGECAPLTCSPERPAFVFFTSGSTGESKGVVLTEYGMLNNTKNQVVGSGGTEEDITLLVVPLHHIFGIAIILGHLSGGSALACPKSREPDHVLDFIERFRCTRFDSVPTYYLMLAEAQTRRPRDLSSLRLGIIAGGTYTRGQFLAIERALGLKLYPSYGMTETSTVICFLGKEGSEEARSGTVGPFMQGIDGVLKKEDGDRPVRVGEVGEVCVRGYCLTLGYLGADGSLSLPLDEEGYFHTGDLARLCEGGALAIVGRCKEIIIRGGENLSPRHIESKLLEVLGVRDACVVGIPSEKYGEEVGACVVSDLSAEEIRSALRLKKGEMPAKLCVAEKIPLLPTGKPDKAAVLALLSERGE